MLRQKHVGSPILCLETSLFFSETIEVDKGCTQGDPDSPIIFNLIIDAVIGLKKKKKKEKTIAKVGHVFMLMIG